jgi:hypothetical protein
METGVSKGPQLRRLDADVPPVLMSQAKTVQAGVKPAATVATTPLIATIAPPSAISCRA